MKRLISIILFIPLIASAQKDAEYYYSRLYEIAYDDTELAFTYSDSVYATGDEHYMRMADNVVSGIYLNVLIQLDSAKLLAKRSYNYFKAKQDTSNLIESISRLANLDRSLGLSETGFNYLKDGQELSDAIEHHSAVAFFGAGIADYYDVIGQKEREIKELLKAAKHARLGETFRTEAFIYMKLVEVYFSQGDSIKAQQYCTKGTDLVRMAKDDFVRSEMCGNCATNYFHVLEFDSSIVWAKEALNYSKDIDDAGLNSFNNMILGQAYYHRGDLMLAKNHLEQSIKILGEKIDLEEEINIYHVYWEVLRDLGESAKALEIYNKYRTANDSLVNMERVQEISNIKFRNDIKLKEEGLLKLEAEAELANEKSQKRKTYIIFISILLALTIGVLVLIFRKNKSISSLNKILKGTLNTVEEQKSLVEKQYESAQEKINDYEFAEGYVVLNSSGLQVNFMDISYLEASKNYILIYLIENADPISERAVFQEFIDQLPKKFTQIHRSFCVNEDAIEKRFSKSLIKMKNGILP